MIISFILMMLMFDLGTILLGEIRWWSLLGVKGLMTKDPEWSPKGVLCIKR